ncbi:hypothetical protein LP419_27420 [Massilia sp. H-1]|nr:hypothetical protein LP419_27420 [Massilia sp. H-1]
MLKHRADRPARTAPAWQAPVGARASARHGQKEGYYALAAVTLDGARAGDSIAWDRLRDGSVIDITLGALRPGHQEIRRVGADPYSESAAVFGPREPAIASLARAADGSVTLALTPSRGAHKTTYNVYRDGKLAAAACSAWAAGPTCKAGPASCYALEAQFALARATAATTARPCAA